MAKKTKAKGTDALPVQSQIQKMHDYMVNVVARDLTKVWQEQGLVGEPYITIGPENDHLVSVAFPLGELMLGQGLIGVNFYSYTIELTLGKRMTDRNIAPHDRNPKDFVAGLLNTYESMNKTIGSLKKCKVLVDVQVAVPADQDYGLIRRITFVAPKGFEKVIPLQEPFNKLENHVDVYGSQGYQEPQQNMVQATMPEGQGIYREPKEPMPTQGQFGDMNDFGPMGPVDDQPTGVLMGGQDPMFDDQPTGVLMGGQDPMFDDQPTGMLMGPADTAFDDVPTGMLMGGQDPMFDMPAQPQSPYATQKPVQDYGFDPYADFNS